MQKKKSWQGFIILAVLALTIYNIFPTIIFYTKPLSAPISEKKSEEISTNILNRVNELEKESLDWLHSFCKLLSIKPEKLYSLQKDPGLVCVTFATDSDAEKFRQYLPRAGSLIPFFASQLALYDVTPLEKGPEANRTLLVKRKIPIHFDITEKDRYTSFANMYTSDGQLTPQYKEVLENRLMEILYSVGGPTENSYLVSVATQKQAPEQLQNILDIIVENILSIDRIFGNDVEQTRVLYATFTQGFNENTAESYKMLLERIHQYKDSIQRKKIALRESLDKDSDNVVDKSTIQHLEKKEEKLLHTLSILKKEEVSFKERLAPWTFSDIQEMLKKDFSKDFEGKQIISTREKNPFIDAVSIDLEKKQFFLHLDADLVQAQKTMQHNDQTSQATALEQMLYQSIAKISQETGENFQPSSLSTYAVNWSSLVNSQSFLLFNLKEIAQSAYVHTKRLVNKSWMPKSQDLQVNNYPLIDWKDYKKQSILEKHLELVLYAPQLTTSFAERGFSQNGIYVIAKDLQKILTKAEKNAQSTEAQQIQSDAKHLVQILQKAGFQVMSGASYPFAAEFADDYIFELKDFYLPTLQATRENFQPFGSKQQAILEFSDVKERILVTNQIENAEQEDLLKWRDEYQAAQVSQDPRKHFEVPEPTKNVLLQNLYLSVKKYFRGDERKVIHWGLDLSGGKTVQLVLKDSNSKVVSNEADIKQGINELYNRVNKMGVSDVSIRQEGTSITMDFPSTDNLSAKELIKASSMTFHIVNEKFSTENRHEASYSSDTNRFLQEVWSEAVVTNKRDVESIQKIAQNHLYGESLDPSVAVPRTEAAKSLYEAGFRLATDNDQTGYEFNDQLSMVTMFRGDTPSQWHGQTHPLLIVFKNHALEGTSLTDVHSSYSPTEGNYLSFHVKNSQTLPSGQKISPQQNLYNWTSVFAKERISGSLYDVYTAGGGWRMAVILNGQVVSAPALKGVIKDSGMISGNFTQREINRLTADLKAGSLSFTPEILSEKSVSPDLGIQERYQGIFATIVALVLVIGWMISYYRFGGFIASIAVVLNLLIIWAVLQNIGATVTLAGLAGVILTLGMAVDANVLVFERIREEYEKTKKISLAVKAGYQKAYSAILDSNITTIIAALILLNFDSGPIKGLALTMIIGIVSSMFTALFMTRFFFYKWIENPRHTRLNMANWIRTKNVNFLQYGKISLLAGVVITIAGCITLYTSQKTIFGMDFMGGYAVNIDIANQKDSDNTRAIVEKALMQAGLSAQDMQIRELHPKNHLRIFLSKTLNEPGKVFYQMPVEINKPFTTYSFEKNPRLEWLVQALEKDGISVSPESLQTLDQNWKSISGQMSDSMRTQALIGLILALGCILIYISFRFEFTFALSATLGLAFDIFVTMGLLAILHALSVPVQIDLNTVAALMMIVGYSLNDTIIVFDRIREDLLVKEQPLRTVINQALNITLSRTFMTSFTTLLVLISLVVLGGHSIFGFSLIMSIGVIVGTLSTLFVVSIILLFLHKKINRNENKELILNGT